MKFGALSLALALNAALSTALKIPFQRAKRSPLQRRSGGASVSVSRPNAAFANSNVLAAAAGGGNNNANAFDMKSVHDLIYIANITLGGTDYPVQLDTGSSDLWVKGSSTPLPNSNRTSQTYNLTYGIGWAYGYVSYASAEFAGISVPQQAFLDSSSAQNPTLSYGADGILGLGFTSLSTIDALVNMTNSSTGRSLLYNLFLDNPKEPNFIAFSLQRNSDQNDTADGSFSVGEYDPQYQSVANSPAIPTFPETSPKRWSVLVDSVVVGSNQIPVTTSVASAPGNKAVALLDSGTSYSYAPPEVCKAIYGGVSGAKFDSGLGQWSVPCDAEIDMALQINNQVYPLHPLDVSPTSLIDPSTCVGSFIPQAVTVGKGEFDWLIGDSFLRSVYTVYDYGDFDSSGKMGNPFIKLLSIVDPTQASVDFHNIRGGTPNTNITYNAANSTDSSTTVSLSDDVAQVLDKIGKFFPAMLAVMAFNALILLVLVIVGVVLLCKKHRPKTSRKTKGRMSPVPLNRTSRFGAESAHAYEPVSMALSEDTFVPPMPAFRGDTARSKNSRKSSYSTISPPSPPSAVSSVAPEDPPFTPPGVPLPAFSGEVRPGDRPMSSIVLSPTRRQSFMPPDRPQSSYIPPANSPRNSQFVRPPATLVNNGGGSRPSFASSVTVPQESPFENQVASMSEERLGDDRQPLPIPSATSPNDSLFVPPSAAFRSNVQPGDRPRSHMPSPVSPEDEIFVPPSAAFRGGDRPRSMA